MTVVISAMQQQFKLHRRPVGNRAAASPVSAARHYRSVTKLGCDERRQATRSPGRNVVVFAGDGSSFTRDCRAGITVDHAAFTRRGLWFQDDGERLSQCVVTAAVASDLPGITFVATWAVVRLEDSAMSTARLW